MMHRYKFSMGGGGSVQWGGGHFAYAYYGKWVNEEFNMGGGVIVNSAKPKV